MQTKTLIGLLLIPVALIGICCGGLMTVAGIGKRFLFSDEAVTQPSSSRQPASAASQSNRPAQVRSPQRVNAQPIRVEAALPKEVNPPALSPDQLRQLQAIVAREDQLMGVERRQLFHGLGRILFLDPGFCRIRIGKAEMRIVAQTEIRLHIFHENGADDETLKGTWSDLRKGMDVAYEYISRFQVGEPAPDQNKNAGVCMTLNCFISAP